MKRAELHKNLQKEFDPERGWGVEKGARDPYTGTWFITPPPPPTVRPSGINLEKLGAAHRVLTELPAADSMSDLDKIILGLLVRREAVASSRMEGTWSTIDHVFTPGELQNTQEKSAANSVREYASALENVYELVKNGGAATLTQDLVKRLHLGFMTKDPEMTGPAGQFRNEVKPPSYVTIGGFPRIEDSLYNPTPPGRLKTALENYFKWLTDDVVIDMGNSGSGLTLALRMAVGHVHFESIHPFSNGNGRVGRMLMALQMVADGSCPLYLSGFIEMRKSDYVAGLGHAQKKLDYAPFIDFLSEAIVASWDETKRSKEVLLTLPGRWKERSTWRADSAAAKTIERLLEHPILTAKGLQALIGVSAPAANNALAQLAGAGVVRERTGHDRNRVFAAEEVISILSRPLDEPAEVAREKAEALLTPGARAIR